MVYTLGVISLATMPLVGWSLVGESEINVSIPNLGLLAFMGTLFSAVLLRGGKIHLPMPRFVIYILYALLTLSLVTAVFAKDPVATARLCFTLVNSMLFLYIGAFTVVNARSPLIWEVALLVGVVISAAVGIGHLFRIIPVFAFEKVARYEDVSGDIDLEAFGYTGLIPIRGDYASWAAVGLYVCGRWLSQPRPWWTRLCALLSLPVILFAVGITLSRSSWLVTGLMMVVIFASTVFWRRRFLGRFHVSLLGIAFLIFSLVLLGVGIFSTLGERLIAIRPETVNYRLVSYTTGVKAWSDHPVFGYGAGVAERYDPYGHVVHNLVLYAMSTYGSVLTFVLLVLLGWLLVSYGRVMMRGIGSSTRFRAILGFGLFVALMIANVFYNGFSSKYFWTILGILIGEITVLSQVSDHRELPYRPH